MEDLANNPAPEAPELAAADETPEAATYEAEDGTEAELQAEAPDDDSEEVEHDGQKYRVPKALKDALLRQSDYTRKTQEVAEQRKALEAEQQRVVQQAEAMRTNIKEYAQLTHLDEQIQTYGKIDWAAFSRDDPAAAQQEWIRFSQIKEHRQGLAGHLQQKEQQMASETQREAAKRTEEARAVLAREIPDWSPELAGKLRDFAVAKGIPEARLAQVTNPTDVKILHLAYLGQQLLDKQKAAVKAPPPAPANTVRKVGGTGKAAPDPSSMSPREMARYLGYPGR